LADARQRIEDALLEELGADGFSLRVIVDDDSIAVRGEVASLDLISRASETIETARGGADVVNLIRLRTRSAGGALAT
jgi:osmotically-inducible protein OsmY